MNRSRTLPIRCVLLGVLAVSLVHQGTAMAKPYRHSGKVLEIHIPRATSGGPRDVWIKGVGTITVKKSKNHARLRCQLAVKRTQAYRKIEPQPRAVEATDCKGKMDFGFFQVNARRTKITISRGAYAYFEVQDGQARFRLAADHKFKLGTRKFSFYVSASRCHTMKIMAPRVTFKATVRGKTKTFSTDGNRDVLQITDRQAELRKSGFSGGFTAKWKRPSCDRFVFNWPKHTPPRF